MRQLGALALLVILLASAPPAGLAQTPETSGDLTLSDDEGDVRVGRGSPAGGPLADYLDLKTLRIYDEDLEGLKVEIAVKNLKQPPQLFFGSSVLYQMNFKLDGTSYYYVVRWSAEDAEPDNQTPGFTPTLCVRTTPYDPYGGSGPGGGCYPRQRSFGGADYSQNRLWAYLPKLSLMGKDPVDGRFGPDYQIQLPKGARIAEIGARAASWSTQLEDRVPDAGDTGGPYEFREAAANDRIRLRLSPKAENQTEDRPPQDYPQYPSRGESSDYPRVSVEPGVTSLVRIDVENLNGAKRIVNLTASLAEKSDAKKWEVRIAPGVQVPGKDVRSVNLVVNATSAITHAETTLVRVVGQSYLFKDEIGAITLRLVASVPPSLAQPTLYFHASDRSGGGGPVNDCGLPFLSYCQATRWLNTIETDGKGNLDAGGDVRRGSFGFTTGGVEYTYGMDASLSRDVVLDAKKPVIALVNVKSQAAMDVSVRLRLYGAEGSDIVDMRSAASLPAGGGVVTLNFLPLVDAARIKAGNRITARLELDYDTIGPGAPAMVSPPYFVPKGSKITLPIIPDPNATVRPNVPVGDAFIGLNLKDTKDGDSQFAYPGRARVFEMTVVNEGGLDDVATITAATTNGKCGIEIRPGSAFKLEGGDSAKFGVLLRPGEKAKEGEQCHVEVNATSTIDPEVHATVRIHIITTSGIEDLPDDSQTYMPDKESAARAAAASPKAKSPAAGLLGTLGVLIVIASRRRRA